MTCSKCSRPHSGICGIPGRGTMRSPGLARPTSSSSFEIHQQIKARKKPKSPVLTPEQEATLKQARANLKHHLGILHGLEVGDVDYEDTFMAVEGWLDEIANLVTGNTGKEK